jgi:ABC-type glycerol-3-phosphate transport system substrate-binding protein
MGDDSKFEGLSSILGVGIAIAVLLAIGVYLVATASPTKKGITTIRWAVDPNPIRPEQIRIFRKQHPNIDVMVDSGANGQSLLTQKRRVAHD